MRPRPDWFDRLTGLAERAERDVIVIGLRLTLWCALVLVALYYFSK
jgi:hypothetical protein